MKGISKAELEILKILWKNPTSIKEIAIELNNKNISTIKTLIYRLIKKDAVICDKTKKPNVYIPKINRKQFLKIETDKFINMLYDNNLNELMEVLNIETKNK